MRLHDFEMLGTTPTHACTKADRDVGSMEAIIGTRRAIDLMILSFFVIQFAMTACFFFQAEDGIRVADVTGVQTCALPIFDDIRIAEGTIAIRNPNVVKVEGNKLVVMARNVSLAVLDADGKERSTHKVAYGAKLLVKEGDAVRRGQRLAEWDPYTRPILAEVEGEVVFEDLLDGTSVAENTDEATGFTKRVVIDWRTNPRGDGLKPALAIARDGAVLKVERGGDARYLLSVDAVIAAEPGEKVSPGDVLARIPLESAKTKDITRSEER